MALYPFFGANLADSCIIPAPEMIVKHFPLLACIFLLGYATLIGMRYFVLMMENARPPFRPPFEL